MSFELPASIEPDVIEYAKSQSITEDEAVARLLRVGLAHAVHGSTENYSYGSLFGAIKGTPGAHGSPEAVDRYIEELRSEW